MGEHRTPFNRRIATLAGASVVAGGLLLAGPAGMACAAPSSGSALGNNVESFFHGLGHNVEGIVGGSARNFEGIVGGSATNFQSFVGGTAGNVQSFFGGLGNNLEKIFGGGKTPTSSVSGQTGSVVR